MPSGTTCTSEINSMAPAAKARPTARQSRRGQLRRTAKAPPTLVASPANSETHNASTWPKSW